MTIWNMLSVYFYVKKYSLELKWVIETWNATFIISFLILIFNFKLKSLTQNPMEKIMSRGKEEERFLHIT